MGALQEHQIEAPTSSWGEPARPMKPAHELQMRLLFPAKEFIATPVLTAQALQGAPLGR
jgi:hypothetical protein